MERKYFCVEESLYIATMRKSAALGYSYYYCLFVDDKRKMMYCKVSNLEEYRNFLKPVTQEEFEIKWKSLQNWFEMNYVGGVATRGFY